MDEMGDEKDVFDQRECKVCGDNIDDLEQGTVAEEAAYDAFLCLTDYEDEANA